MPHDIRKLIQDMLTFIQQLERFLGGRTLEDLRRDELHLRAIEMQFVLIAEVLKRMEQVSPEVHLRVDHLRDIAGMRNTIVHNYDDVDIEIVHAASTLNLPVLKRQIKAWAAELGMESPPEQAR